MTSAVAVSVIIPTHDRRDHLHRLLAALSSQREGTPPFEVIVVADGCTDDTGPATRSLAVPYPLTVLEQEGLGAGNARNAGARVAQGHLLLFLDDDVEPAPGLVAEHAAAHHMALDSPRVVLGPYRLPESDEIGFYPTHVRAWWADLFSAMARPGHRFAYRDILAGNLSLPVAVWRSVGGFDPAFRGCGGEDWELGVRLLAAGIEPHFASDAEAVHHVSGTGDVPGSFERARQEGVADVLIGSRHAALRPSLDLRHWTGVTRRLLPRLAVSWPAAGDPLARSLMRLLDPLERVNARWLWRRLYAGLRWYWYWRGAAQRLGSSAKMRRFLDAEPPETSAPLRVDLSLGLEGAEERLEHERPTALEISWRDRTIGTVSAEPGAEPLRGRHLRPLLVERFARELFDALDASGRPARWLEGDRSDPMSGDRQLPVSVIIPAYRARATLGETLASLIAQTHEAWEAIIVDDGSDDGTLELAREWAETDARMRVLKRPHRGVSAARNAGLDEARHAWAVFLDADDTLAPDFLAVMTGRLLSEPRLDVVVCHSVLVDPSGRRLAEREVLPPADPFPWLATRCPFDIHACIVRRSLVRSVGAFDESLVTCEDWDLWIRLGRIGARLGVVAEPLAIVRVRADSTSSDGHRLFPDLMTVLERAHRPDARVRRSLPRNAEGAPRWQLPEARLLLACWAAGLILARGGEVGSLLDGENWECAVCDPALTASILFQALCRGRHARPREAAEFWPEIRQPVLSFVDELADRSRSKTLRRRTEVQMERLIASASPAWTGHWVAAASVEITQPLEDIEGPRDGSVVCHALLEGQELGTLELPTPDGLLPRAVLADALAARLGWTILGRFLERHVYPELDIRREDGHLSLRRDGRELGRMTASQVAPDPCRLHEEIGWTVFLQELWGESRLLHDDFYPRKRTRRAPTGASSPGLRSVEIAAPLPSLRDASTVMIELGGRALGALTVDHEAGRLPADSLRAAINRAAGFELCIVAVERALLGRPLHGSPLRERLREASVAADGPRHAPFPELFQAMALPPADLGLPPACLLLGRTESERWQGSSARRYVLPVAASEALDRQGVATATVGTASAAPSCLIREPSLIVSAPGPASTMVASSVKHAWDLSRRRSRGAPSESFPILRYLRVVSDSESPQRLAVSTERLEEQLRFLRQAGYRSLVLMELLEAIAARRPVPARSVLMTFDDGYRDFETNAWPLLRRHGFTAIVFLVSERIGGRCDWPGEAVGASLMDWSQIRALEGAGVRFGCHSAHHSFLTSLSPAELVEELCTSKARLEEGLGRAIEAFAYPYGHHDAKVRHAVGACGFEAALLAGGGIASVLESPLELRRIEITGLDDLESFARKLQTAPDPAQSR